LHSYFRGDFFPVTQGPVEDHFSAVGIPLHLLDVELEIEELFKDITASDVEFYSSCPTRFAECGTQTTTEGDLSFDPLPGWSDSDDDVVFKCAPLTRGLNFLPSILPEVISIDTSWEFQGDSDGCDLFFHDRLEPLFGFTSGPIDSCTSGYLAWNPKSLLFKVPKRDLPIDYQIFHLLACKPRNATRTSNLCEALIAACADPSLAHSLPAGASTMDSDDAATGNELARDSTAALRHECRFFAMAGWCKYGDGCKFSHSKEAVKKAKGECSVALNTFSCFCQHCGKRMLASRDWQIEAGPLGLLRCDRCK